MSTKEQKPEQIVNLLRQVEVEIANGKTTPQACRDAGITAQTYYRWRKEFGGLKLDPAKRLKELEKENARLKRLVADLSLEKQFLRDVAQGNERRRCAVERAREEYGLCERHACRLLGQGRGPQRYPPILRSDEDALTRAIITLASQYGRYGYRQIGALLQKAGWQVGRDRVQRIWRREGLKVPTEAARATVVERRLVGAAAAGAGEPCMELRLCECRDARRQGVAIVDADRRIHTGVPGDPRGTAAEKPGSNRDAGRGDAGARHPGVPALGQWARIRGPGATEVARLGTGTLYIEPGSPWENGSSTGSCEMNA